MNQIPFSVYDFFGYLASGAVVMAGLTASFVAIEPFETTPPLLLGLLMLIVAYVLGQIVGNISGDLIEGRLVRNRLQSPTTVLMSGSQGSRLAKLFPGYFRSLPQETQKRVRERATVEGVEGTGEELFFHCHATMKSDPVVYGRLETFLNLYGFCRNMSVALLIAAMCLGIGIILGTAETGPRLAPGWWIAGAVAGSVGMLYRYLKFFRQFGVELLTSYAKG